MAFAPTHFILQSKKSNIAPMLVVFVGDQLVDHTVAKLEDPMVVLQEDQAKTVLIETLNVQLGLLKDSAQALIIPLSKRRVSALKPATFAEVQAEDALIMPAALNWFQMDIARVLSALMRKRSISALMPVVFVKVQPKCARIPIINVLLGLLEDFAKTLFIRMRSRNNIAQRLVVFVERNLLFVKNQ